MQQLYYRVDQAPEREPTVSHDHKWKGKMRIGTGQHQRAGVVARYEHLTVAGVTGYFLTSVNPTANGKSG
jgi:hypothetical protein